METPPEVQGAPPITKNTIITPLAVNIVKRPDGISVMEFLVNPFELVTVQFDDDARQAIIRELTGGIVIAPAAAVQT